MKAFQFRLEQTLRWRATQVEIEKSRVAAAAQSVTNLQRDLDSLRTELVAGSVQLAERGAAGDALSVWAAFENRTHRQVKEKESKVPEALKALSEQMNVLVQANRRLQLLENLRQKASKNWQADLNRELEAFAGEAYLVRLQSKNGRARSSGG